MSRPGQAYEPILAGWAVGSVVRDICERAGIPYDRMNVDLVEGYVDGFSTTSGHSAASAIESLSAIYLFDPANFGGVLHFVPRGGASVASIELDDIVDDGEEIEEVSRRDSITVPRVINLQYLDTEGGLTADKQTSDRSIDNRSKAESSTETTVIMRADDAARAVVISHKVGIEEQRGEIGFSLPSDWLELTTADVITFRGDRMRITECDIDDGQQHYKAVFDRASAYETEIQGIPIEAPSEAPGLVIGESRMEFIDSPIVRSADDRLGYYIAVSSVSLNWSGAVVEISKDGGANWIDSDSTTSNAIMGSLSAPLDSHTEYYRDDTNTVAIELLRDDMELLPATMAEMLNRSNLALVGDELINFSDAVQTGPTTWELRGLLRGRKGSGAVSHPAGARFVLMDSLSLAFVDAELFELNRSLTFRVTSFGLTSGPTATVKFVGRAQQERSPAYLKAVQDGSDLHVSWQGVGRLGGGASVAMGAYFVGYRVTLGTSIWDTNDLNITIPYAAGTLSVQQRNSITGFSPATTVTV